MSWTRLSPGIYKNDQTGEVRRSATRPTDTPAPAPAPPAPAAPAPSMNFQGFQNPTPQPFGQMPGVAFNPTDPNALTMYGPQYAGLQTAYGNLLTNPNQYGPFGQQEVYINPETGQPAVFSGLSQNQQGVVSGIEQGGMAANQQLQNLIQGFLSPGEGGAISGLEDAVFERLTKGLEDQRAQDTEQLEQVLANRGIPQGSELWNNQLEELNTRYDERLDAAKNQAVQTGINTSLSAIPQFAQIGQGAFFNPQFQGFQANPFQQTNPFDIYRTNVEAQLRREGFDTDRYIANRRGSGGFNFGGGAPAAPEFPTGPIPGQGSQ